MCFILSPHISFPHPSPVSPMASPLFFPPFLSSVLPFPQFSLLFLHLLTLSIDFVRLFFHYPSTFSFYYTTTFSLDLFFPQFARIFGLRFLGLQSDLFIFLPPFLHPSQFSPPLSLSVSPSLSVWLLPAFPLLSPPPSFLRHSLNPKKRERKKAIFYLKSRITKKERFEKMWSPQSQVFKSTPRRTFWALYKRTLKEQQGTGELRPSKHSVTKHYCLCGVY